MNDGEIGISGACLGEPPPGRDGSAGPWQRTGGIPVFLQPRLQSLSGFCYVDLAAVVGNTIHQISVSLTLVKIEWRVL